MAAPLVYAATAVRREWANTDLLGKSAAVIVLSLVLAYAFISAVAGSLVGSMGNVSTSYLPSPVAVADIPAPMLALYEDAAQTYNIDWAVLAAIYSIESNHNRSTAQGVHSGVNFAGCCAGPGQFSVIGSPSTWDAYGQGGDVYDPKDAVPATARYLVANGAPHDYRQAVFAYNHADWYVNEVLQKAASYRAAQRPAGSTVPTADSIDVLNNSRIVLTAGQRIDITLGGLDPRMLATMAWLGQRHTYIVTALRKDHHPGTNHEAGRAFDIGSVDGEVCSETWGAPPRRSKCGLMGKELAAVDAPMRSTELIYCWDLDGPSDPRGFARADHCDHLHVGWDG